MACSFPCTIHCLRLLMLVYCYTIKSRYMSTYCLLLLLYYLYFHMFSDTVYSVRVRKRLSSRTHHIHEISYTKVYIRIGELRERRREPEKDAAWIFLLWYLNSDEFRLWLDRECDSIFYVIRSVFAVLL